MARRADHTREELKALAVNAAVALIEENGIRDFSARQVAARIGYTVGTLYNVFEGYDDLLLHAHGRTLDDWHAFLAERLKRSKAEALRVLARGYIDFARANFNRWSALFEQGRGEPAPLPDWYREKLNRLFDMLEAAIPAGTGKAKAAKRTAQVLWAGIHGICVLALSGKLAMGGEDSPETLANTLLDTYLRGLDS
jgi:AcrR family transcriptional regulator